MKYPLAVVLLVAASSACADPVTIYRYRDADGKSHYSDKPIPGGKLIETFQYTIPTAASPQPDTSKSDAEGEARIKKHLAALEAAWAEVQASERALTTAEARQAAGNTPHESEVLARGGPVAPGEAPGEAPAPPSAGGPLPPATQANGGPAPAAPPSAGGPMAVRRGGGRRPEYRERLAELEKEVAAARTRNQEAWRRYNQLR
jgi:hypothetical protein